MTNLAAGHASCLTMGFGRDGWNLSQMTPFTSSREILTDY